MATIVRTTTTSKNPHGAQMRAWLYTNLTLRGSI